MEKSMLDKKIEERAQKRLAKELDDAREAVRKNPILDRLTFTVVEGDKKNNFYLGQYLWKNSVFSGISNLDDQIERRLQEIIESETNSLLNKVDEIKDFLDNQEY